LLINNYINGKWQLSRNVDYFNNVSPITDEILDQFNESSLEDIENAVGAAKEVFTSWKKLSSIQRGQYLFQAANWLSSHLEDIADDLMKEEGKSFSEATGEVNRAIQTLYYYASEGYQTQGDVIPSSNPSVLIYTKSVPLGVVALITPWNFPIAIPIWKIAPALVYGNTVILKPSEHAPKSAYYVMRAFEEVNLPPGVLNCIFGTNPMLGEGLIRHQDVQAVSFTGSNEVGSKIQSLAAAHHKKVQLEMGGSNPLIVLDDADLEKAVTYTIQDAFSNAGQKCTAASRILVQTTIYEKFKNKLVQEIQRLKNNEHDFFRPVATKRQFANIQEVIEETSKSATNILELSTSKSEGYFIEPTVFEVDIEDKMLLEQEVFGPVVTLLKFENLEEAIAIANATFLGLSAAIFTQNIANAMTFIEEVEAGMVHVNLGTVHTELQVPFGGTKYSSAGPKEQGKAARAFFTTTKVIYQNALASH